MASIPRKGRTPGIQGAKGSQRQGGMTLRRGGGAKGPGWSLGLGGFELAGSLGLLAASTNALKEAAEALQAQWTLELSNPGTGKQYEEGIRFVTRRQRVFPVPGDEDNPGRQRAHRASAPGEPPAPDDGILRTAVQIEKRNPFHYVVGMGGRIGGIGLALEFGVNVPGSRVGAHPGGIRIRPRPHARPARKKAKDRMGFLVKSKLKTGFSGGGGP